MNKLFLVFGLCLLAAPAAFACEGEGEHHMMMGGHPHEMTLPGVLDDHMEPKMGPCSEIKLDADQKTKLKNSYFKFKEAKIDLEAKVEKAHLQFEKLMADSEATSDAAKSASQDMISAVTAMMQAHANYENEVMFDILKAQQRRPAHACMMEMAKFHGGPKECERCHEHGPGAGPDHGPDHGKKDKKHKSE